jgi:hypothetical protein
MPIAPGEKVVFAAGANLSTGGHYPTPSVNYAIETDMLSIHPQFDMNNSGLDYGADLVLLRIHGTPWIGSVPTSFLPLNTNDCKTAIPPAFGITIGYGTEGNGIDGAYDLNDALERRAGLTEVVVIDPFHLNTLASVFRSPKNFPPDFPSNFLQAAPGGGDSGGPLIMNLGAGDAIVGVVQDGGNDYGTVNYWTRISSYYDWIISEAAVLGSAPIASVSGSTADTPLLPQTIVFVNPKTAEKFFQFYIGPGFPVFLDPDPSEQVEIEVTSGPRMTSVLLPVGSST